MTERFYRIRSRNNTVLRATEMELTQTTACDVWEQFYFHPVKVQGVNGANTNTFAIQMRQAPGEWEEFELVPSSTSGRVTSGRFRIRSVRFNQYIRPDSNMQSVSVTSSHNDGDSFQIVTRVGSLVLKAITTDFCRTPIAGQGADVVRVRSSRFDTYWRATDSALDQMKGQPQIWEEFNFIPVKRKGKDGATVSTFNIRTYHNRFVCADIGGKIEMRDSPGEWEEFEIVPAGNNNPAATAKDQVGRFRIKSVAHNTVFRMQGDAASIALFPLHPPHELDECEIVSVDLSFVLEDADGVMFPPYQSNNNANRANNNLNAGGVSISFGNNQQQQPAYNPQQQQPPAYNPQQPQQQQLGYQQPPQQQGGFNQPPPALGYNSQPQQPQGQPQPTANGGFNQPPPALGLEQQQQQGYPQQQPQQQSPYGQQGTAYPPQRQGQPAAGAAPGPGQPGYQPHGQSLTYATPHNNNGADVDCCVIC